MRFAVFTHVDHVFENHNYYGYGPYVKEMNIWFKYADEVQIVAPLSNRGLSSIDLPYLHSNLKFKQIPIFDIVSLRNAFKTLLVLPILFWNVFLSMLWADHIHLRCPGNVGLIASFVQILFPWKKKTAKYAGNWDPKAKQPLSYKLQKWILSNAFLTRNMQVLVYGEWVKQTRNIKPFFTASYSEKEIKNLKFKIQNSDSLSPIVFLFVGTLSHGKEPLYAIELVEEFAKKKHKVALHLYGDGILKNSLSNYVLFNKLDEIVFFHGNQEEKVIKEAYQNANYLILPSRSEGWPKVVAEAMFWGCIPVVTPVSCVPFMLNYGERGIVMAKKIQNDTKQIIELINDKEKKDQMSRKAMQWSQKYTLEYFEEEISKLM
ncbi:glycosyltransferase family 4 protein [Flavobacterium sp.]|uniref:glycosyltransferase family 4 protein n=1 Tax=Flavobacterium sp. TaxID=239 RepID=UPI003D13E7F8